jgi:hypothetical protein
MIVSNNPSGGEENTKEPNGNSGNIKQEAQKYNNISKTKQFLLNQLLTLLNADSESPKKTKILLKQISNLLDAPDKPHNPIFFKYGVELPFKMLDAKFKSILQKEFL